MFFSVYSIILKYSAFKNHSALCISVGRRACREGGNSDADVTWAPIFYLMAGIAF
jgi:hypothetical protein